MTDLENKNNWQAEVMYHISWT